MEPSGLLYETTSLCRVCKDAVAAVVVARGHDVWLEKHCEDHGAQEVKLSDDASWYMKTRETKPIPSPPTRSPRPIALGCPFDCGACASHEQRVRLPVVTITSACNLDCPICYVHNKNDGAYHMSRDEFARVLEHLAKDGGGDVDLVNLTGGEPFLHPHYLEFLEMARDAGVHRVSICTNGLRIAKDEALAKRLGELGARIALSFDTFELEADIALQGVPLAALKLRCLDLLEQYNVNTTLIPVMTKGVNDHEIGRILDHAMNRRNVRHVEIHTITYTGQSGVSFDRSGRIGIREVLRRIEETTEGWLRADDFVPSPAAHSLCYQIAYVLMDPEGGKPVPFTRFLDRQTLYECLGDHLYIEPTPRLEASMRDAIDRCFAEGTEESERVLRILKGVIREMFPSERRITYAEALHVSERASKAIYVHSHMDEETWDNERIVQCCDSNCYADGSSIPVCAYNVLYREREEHFMMKPVLRPPPRGGRLLPLLTVR